MSGPKQKRCASRAMWSGCSFPCVAESNYCRFHSGENMQSVPIYPMLDEDLADFFRPALIVADSRLPKDDDYRRITTLRGANSRRFDAAAKARFMWERLA